MYAPLLGLCLTFIVDAWPATFAHKFVMFKHWHAPFFLFITLLNNIIDTIILMGALQSQGLPFFSRLRRSLIASYIWCIPTPPDSDSSSRHSVRSLSALANAAGVIHAHCASSSRMGESACSKVSSNSFHRESGSGTTVSGCLASACGCRKCVVS